MHCSSRVDRGPSIPTTRADSRVGNRTVHGGGARCVTGAALPGPGLHERLPSEAMWSAIVAVAGRPDLWPTALRAVWRIRRDRWWRRPPFVPVPDRGYLRLRAVTAYGDPDRAPDAADVVAWLEWCRDDAGLDGRYHPDRAAVRD